MQTVASSRMARACRMCSASRRSQANGRSAVVVRAETGTVETPAPSVSSPSTSKIAVPEWVPEQAAPVLEFFVSDDFKLQDNDLYKKYLQQYVENEYFSMCVGFKAVPEVINGRAAMLGFIAAAGAEIFGAGSFLAQLSRSPQPVLVVLALIVAGSVIPIVKGAKGDYLESLKETYTVPEGVFTENMEKLHGRLAMVGIAGLLTIELLKATPLL